MSETSDVNDRHYEGTDNLEAMAEARNYNRFLTGLVTEDVQGRGPVADFGAGTGLLAGMVAEAGIDVICVEPDPSFRERLRALSLVAHSSLDALAPDSLPYVYSFNALEHIEDDLAACQAVYRSLAPGGRFLVYVPAFQLLYTAMDRRVGHFRRYTRDSLVALLGEAGFTVQRAEYADSLGFLATLAFKWLGDSGGSIDKSSVAFYDSYLFPFSRVCDRLFGGFLGKNVLVIAQKPAQQASGTAASESRP